MNVGLILDEKPEWCEDCIAYREHYDLCGMVGKRNPHEWLPDWCPLQEVEPVRHGMWYEKKASFGDYVYEVCSVCGEERYMESIYPDEAGYYYCPNCGAKMDLEWRDDDDGGAE